MAIFKTPRISTANRMQLTLEESEIVYDSDLKHFFGGDGQTIGGIRIGANEQLKFFKEEIILNQNQISSGIINLQNTPDKPETVRLIPKNGIEQDNGDDFSVSNNQLVFSNLGLDGFLELGETIYIYYTSIIYS